MIENPSKDPPSSEADSSISIDPNPPSPIFQRPGWPRRPGTYPSDYPLERILAEDPTPGQPLQFRTPTKAPEAPIPLAHPRLIDHRMTAIGKIQRASSIIAAFPEFHPLDAPPPPFTAKRWRYPSRRSEGTCLCPAFEEQLRRLTQPTPISRSVSDR